MKALLLEEYRRLVVADVATHEPADDEILLRVRACGICGSDVHGYDGSSGRRIPPIVMGHEAAGDIVAVGAGVTGWQPGDRVGFDSIIFCGACPSCQRGEVNLCDQRQVLGVSCGDYRRPGAFAEFVTVPARVLYRLPDGLDYATAALAEPVAVALHAVAQVNPSPRDAVAVIGAGMIGVLIVQVLRNLGCHPLIAVDLDLDRLDLAARLGATHGILPNAADAPARIRELTGGRGADIAFEVVGATAPVRTAVDSVRKGGAIVLVGNLAPSVDLPLQSVVTRQLRLLGTCGSSGEYPAALEELASGRIDVAPIISARAPLSEGSAWFDRLYAREKNLMKVVLEP